MSGPPNPQHRERHRAFRRRQAPAAGRPADPTLFDTTRTIPVTCPAGHCQAIRMPGQDRVLTCAHDLDPEARRRPRGCLNATDPAHTHIPY